MCSQEPGLYSSRTPRGDPSRTIIPPFQRLSGPFRENPSPHPISQTPPSVWNQRCHAQEPSIWGPGRREDSSVPTLTRNPHQLPSRKSPLDLACPPCGAHVCGLHQTDTAPSPGGHMPRYTASKSQQVTLLSCPRSSGWTQKLSLCVHKGMQGCILLREKRPLSLL